MEKNLNLSLIVREGTNLGPQKIHNYMNPSVFILGAKILSHSCELVHQLFSAKR